MLKIITIAGHLRVRFVGVLCTCTSIGLLISQHVSYQTERVDGKWEDWSHHDSSYSGYTLGCVLTFINAAMMTAVQHAVQYGCVSNLSAISPWRIIQKYKLNAAHH